METEARINELFAIGAHIGYGRSRRHPTTTRFVFGTKNGADVVDLAKTIEQLDAAKAYVTSLGRDGKKLMLVGDKHEARAIVRAAALKLGMPFVADRWIGGTMTNFSEVKKRVARVRELREMKGGGFAGYTKGEKSLFLKELAKLETKFEGILDMPTLPHAMFVVDSRSAEAAIEEAKKLNIPVVSISSTDCDLSSVNYPIVANDTSRTSIAYFVDQIVAAYEMGRNEQVKASPVTA